MSARSILSLGARVFLLRRKVVYEAGLDEIRRCEPRIPVRFRAGNRDDLERLSEGTHDYDVSARAFGVERLRAGDTMTIGESGNNIVFYNWLMYGQLDMGLRRYLPLAADSAYLYRLFTVAAYRGKGLAQAHFWFIREQLRLRNARRIVSWVEARNAASRRVFVASGFREIGCIWHIQFLFRTYFYASPELRAKLRDPKPGTESTAITARAGQGA